MLSICVWFIKQLKLGALTMPCLDDSFTKHKNKIKKMMMQHKKQGMIFHKADIWDHDQQSSINFLAIIEWIQNILSFHHHLKKALNNDYKPSPITAVKHGQTSIISHLSIMSPLTSQLFIQLSFISAVLLSIQPNLTKVNIASSHKVKLSILFHNSQPRVSSLQSK